MNFDSNKDYYGILRVMPSAEMAVIKAAYKALAGVYHPDRNQSNEAVFKMQAINEAWDVLSNKETKKQYDAIIDKQRSKNDAFEDMDEDEAVDKYFDKDSLKEQDTKSNDPSIVSWLLWMIIGSIGIAVMITALG